MYKYVLIILGIGIFFPAKSQTLHGTVRDSQTAESLPGANVYWNNTTTGTITDQEGKFSLEAASLPQSLIISFVGYRNDTILVESVENPITISLVSSLNINAVEVTENRGAFTMSSMDKLNTEHINRGVLRKAACCNLSESFETTASVDVVLNDAITGTRKIQMLGLDGIYVQNLFEGIPFTRGLANVQGFDQIPGPWISDIQLTKGIGTVQNGYESMTGQININFLPPDGPETIYLDFFANDQSRFEANAIWTKPINNRWSTALFFGGNLERERVDKNKDGFMDMPVREGFKLMNRWKYDTNFLRSQLTVRYNTEERMAGQTGFNFNDDFGKTNLYGFGLNFDQVEVMGKVGILSKARQDRSLGITGIYSYVDVDSYFGNTIYTGIEESARINTLFESKFSEYSDHSYTAGLHFLYDKYDESFADSAFSREEIVPGAYLEYTYDRPRFTFVAGARSDFHNIYGTQFLPRVHGKYNLKPLTTLRATLGRGFRSPNAFADQLGVLASSRHVRVLHTPEAESSWNTGLSLLHKFQLFDREAVFNVDYYYTIFENQLVVDRDYDVNQLLFYNLDGKSDAHSFQTDFQTELLKGLGVKLSYKYQIVEVDYISGKLEKPLVPNHRALFNVGYTSPEGKWYIDATANYYGSSRLPSTSQNPEAFQVALTSDEFFIFNSQITRVFKNFEVYAGAENIGNFIQKDAIIDAENPFGSNFDSSLIYGPVNGRTFYAGVRLTITNPSKQKN